MESQRLLSRISELADRLQTLQHSLETEQRSAQTAQTHFDRKVDEAVAVAQNSLTQVQLRAARLEETVRDSELALRTQTHSLKEEVRLPL